MQLKLMMLQKVRYELEKGYELAISGRPGPVIFDIPFNIQRTMVNPKKLLGFKLKKKKDFTIKYKQN